MADAWVAPDSRPEEPAPAASTTTAPAGAAAARSGRDQAAAVPVPVPLRPMTLSDLLDGSLRIIKIAPGTVIGLAAVVTVPAQLALGIASRRTLEETDLEQIFDDAITGTTTTSDAAFEAGSFALGLVLEGIVLALVAGGLAVLVTGWYAGRRAALGEILRATAQRAPALLLAWVLVHLAEAVAAIVLVFGAVAAMGLFLVVTPIVTCERLGPVRSMRRSWRLTRPRFWPVVGTGLAVAVVDLLLTSALTGVAQLYLLFDLPAGWAVSTAVAAAAGLVVVPFVAGVAVLQYLDLRMRVEGLDIELAARARFAPRGP